MQKKSNNTRRSFIKKIGTSAALASAVPSAMASSPFPQGVEYLNLVNRQKISANDRIKIAVIGTGGMGMGDVNTALMVEGVEVVAACDLYDGRLTRAKELWGKDLFTTKDYREILERSDVDAVINATTDHWHEKICLDAMEKGKHVYCEKPMVQKSPEGHNIIDMDYPATEAHPAFNLALRSNLASGGGNNYLFRIVGTEGDISIGFTELTLRRTPFPKAPGMSIHTFPEAMQEAYKKEYDQKYPQKAEMVSPQDFSYKVPLDYKGDRYEHFVNFFDSIRTGKPSVEDATFGLRASGPTEAGNISYYEKKIMGWDPEKMVLVDIV